MKTYRNISLVGSSHVSESSVKEVKDSFNSLQPDIVAVELDPNRAAALFERKKPNKFLLLKMLGLPGFLFYVFGEFIQKNLGKIAGIDPGAEMKTAILLAKENRTMVFLIDRDIRITLTRFSKYFRKRELLKMIYDLFFGKKEKLNFDLRKVPSEEVIDYAIKEVRNRYPSVYKVLIEERDSYMSRKLHSISNAYPDKKIMAVVGAGHIKGILKNLEKPDNDKF